MCLVSLCVLRLTNIGFVQCLHLGSLWNFARVFLCFSQTSGLCSAFPSAPCSSFYAYLCHVTLCVLRFTKISFVQCFRLDSLFSLHAYIGHVSSKQSNLFLHFLSTSKRFSRFSVPDAFYKSRKTRSQRAIGLHWYFHNLGIP